MPTTDDPMPVFTLKAKDKLAIGTLAAYRNQCAAADLYDQAGEVGIAIAEMIDWANRNPHLMQWPDHKHVPVEGGAVSPVDTWRAVIVEVLCSQALADDLGDVRDAEGRLWRLLGVEEPVPEHDSAWRNTRDALLAAGIPLPAHLADDEEDEG
jgi:hypothetical protein